MFGTAMPEASVYKDREASTCEDDVWPDKSAADPDGEIFAVSESEPVKGKAQRHFRFRIGSPDRSHVA